MPTEARLECRRNLAALAAEMPDIRDGILYIGTAGSLSAEDDFEWLKGREYKTVDVNERYNPDIVADITTAWNIPDGSAKCIVLSQTLEHIFHKERALATCFRLLRDGGWLIVDCPWVYEYHTAEGFDDYWRMTAAALERLLEDAGFAEVYAEQGKLQTFAKARKRSATVDAAAQHEELLSKRSGTIADILANRVKVFIELCRPMFCEDDRFVDFGGGVGRAARLFQSLTYLPMEVCDADADAVAEARASGLKAVPGTLEFLPYDDASVQWGFCSHTLEHTALLGKSLRELHRVVTCGVFVVVPLEHWYQREKDAAHLNNHPDPRWWEERAKRAGWHVSHTGIIDSTNGAPGKEGREMMMLLMKHDFHEQLESEKEEVSAALKAIEDRQHADALRLRVNRAVDTLTTLRRPFTGKWIDVGGGAGDAAERLKALNGGSMTVVDNDPAKLLDASTKGIDIVQDDAQTLEHIADGSIDGIFTSHTLEHVEDLTATLASFKRVLRPGGTVFATVPLQDAEHCSMLYQSHRRFISSVEGWVAAFAAAGFKIEHATVQKYFNDLPEADIVAVKESA